MAAGATLRTGVQGVLYARSPRTSLGPALSPCSSADSAEGPGVDFEWMPVLPAPQKGALPGFLHVPKSTRVMEPIR
jgi:hypothetical protein